MSKKIAVLFDMSVPPPESGDYSEILENHGWESERAILKTLNELGYESFPLGVFDNIQKLILDLNQIQPSIVFNLTEAFQNKRSFEPHIASLLELLQIAYTGARPLALSLCQDKSLSKKILAHHHIRVPKWLISSVSRPVRSLKNFAYPAFVKPANEEGSEGISQDSFVENEKDCLARIHFLHERFQADVMVEEFINGREFYMGVMGVKRVQVLPPRELCFNEFPEDAPKFATFKAKWDEAYRKKWGIRNEFARHLSSEQADSMADIAKRSFECLHLSGVARFDFRISESGEVVLLEANPNPSLDPEDDFAKSADKAGITYPALIEKLLELAW
jgi:D-alanine-D-alanine ligase